MKKLKVPSLVTVAILTLITVVFWTFFNVFRVLTTKPTPNVPEEILESLTPSLDRENLNKMAEGIFL